MAAVRRCRLVASCLVLAPALTLSTGGLASATAQAPPAPEPPVPITVDLSSDVAQGLFDRLSQFLVFPPFPLFPPPGSVAIKEVTNLNTVVPFAQRWRDAIARRDRPGSIQAGEDYEAAWQAVEVYINHRSLPLYTDIEPDTQFVIDAGLQQPQPDWPSLLQSANHLRQAFTGAIAFISTQPPLSPLFDDLVPLRGARSQLLISSNALAAGDVVKARTFFNRFKDRFGTNAQNLIQLRSPSALQETNAASDALTTAFAANATAAQLTPLLAPLLATLNNRVGYGINLVNAAARAADLHTSTFTDADKTTLTQLNKVALDLKQGTAAAGDTSPGSPFGAVQPTLEAKARLVNTAATLRTALVTYVNATPAQKDAAKKTALEAVALGQQTIVGQFWTDPALKIFLQGLPT
jgi:hypothetical protein